MPWSGCASPPPEPPGNRASACAPERQGAGCPGRTSTLSRGDGGQTVAHAPGEAGAAVTGEIAVEVVALGAAGKIGEPVAGIVGGRAQRRGQVDARCRATHVEALAGGVVTVGDRSLADQLHLGAPSGAVVLVVHSGGARAQRRHLLGESIEADIVLPVDGAGDGIDDAGQAIIGIPGVGAGGAQSFSGVRDVVMQDATPLFRPHCFSRGALGHARRGAGDRHGGARCDDPQAPSRRCPGAGAQARRQNHQETARAPTRLSAKAPAAQEEPRHYREAVALIPLHANDSEMSFRKN